jgi:hypothetical protein
MEDEEIDWDLIPEYDGRGDWEVFDEEQLKEIAKRQEEKAKRELEIFEQECDELSSEMDDWWERVRMY